MLHPSKWIKLLWPANHLPKWYQNDLLFCMVSRAKISNVYFCPSNIFQLPSKVAIGAKHAQLSYLNQRILELESILGTLWGCFCLHNQPTSPPTIRIIGHVALNQRLIKIRNHLNRWTLWIEPSTKILTIRIQVTCMAGILETVMLQPCSFSMNVYDTQHHTTPTSLWTRAASCHLASWILSIKFGIKTVLPLPKEPKKMDLFPAFDQCWNSLVLEFFVELHNARPGIYTTRLIPGKRTPQKKHTDKFWGVHTLCIHPLRYTPPKFNMEPENRPLEKEKHLPNHHFWVPC